MNNLAQWAVEVFKRSGAHTGMGFDLYGAFLDAGLPEPTLRYTAPMGARRRGRLSIRRQQFSQHTSAHGSLRDCHGGRKVDIETLPQRLRAEVVASKRPILLPPHVTGWDTTSIVD